MSKEEARKRLLGIAQQVSEETAINLGETPDKAGDISVAGEKSQEVILRKERGSKQAVVTPNRDILGEPLSADQVRAMGEGKDLKSPAEQVEAQVKRPVNELKLKKPRKRAHAPRRGGRNDEGEKSDGGATSSEPVADAGGGTPTTAGEMETGWAGPRGARSRAQVDVLAAQAALLAASSEAVPDTSSAPVPSTPDTSLTPISTNTELAPPAQIEAAPQAPAPSVSTSSAVAQRQARPLATHMEQTVRAEDPDEYASGKVWTEQFGSLADNVPPGTPQPPENQRDQKTMDVLGVPVKDQMLAAKISSLREKLDQDRREYLQKEIEDTNALKTVKSFFRNLSGLREDMSEVAEFREWYKHSLIELAELELQAISQSGLSETEIKEKKASYLHDKQFGEAERIDDVRRQLRHKKEEEQGRFLDRTLGHWAGVKGSLAGATSNQKLWCVSKLGWQTVAQIGKGALKAGRRVGEAVQDFNRTKLGKAVMVAGLGGAGAVVLGAATGGTATAIIGALAVKRLFAGAGLAVGAETGGAWAAKKIRERSSKRASEKMAQLNEEALMKYLREQIVFKSDDELEKRKVWGVLRSAGAISAGAVVGGWLNWFQSDTPGDAPPISDRPPVSPDQGLWGWEGNAEVEGKGATIPADSPNPPEGESGIYPQPEELTPQPSETPTVEPAVNIGNTEGPGPEGTKVGGDASISAETSQAGAENTHSNAPEVVPEASADVSAKIETILTKFENKTIPENYSLWKHSTVIGKEFGFDQKGQYRLAAMIEGAIREKIGANPELLKEGSYMKGQFLTSDGERLWLKAGENMKDIFPSDLLSHDELAKIVAEAKAQSGMTSPLGSTIAATESVTLGTPAATAEAPTTPPESPVAVTADHAQPSGGDPRITFFDADASEDRGSLYPQPEELASQSTPTETEPSENTDTASVEPSERPPVSTGEKPWGWEGRGEIEQAPEDNTRPETKPDSSSAEEAKERNSDVVPETPKLTAEVAASMVGRTPAPTSYGLEAPSNNEGTIAVASSIGTMATGAELIRRKLKKPSKKEKATEEKGASETEITQEQRKQQFSSKGDFINGYIRTLDRDPQRQLFDSYRKMLNSWLGNSFVKDKSKDDLAALLNVSAKKGIEDIKLQRSPKRKDKRASTMIFPTKRQEDRLIKLFEWASSDTQLGESGAPSGNEKVREYILRIFAYAHATGAKLPEWK